MLQDMIELEEVSESVSHASNITKYIYNHCYALYLVKKQTGVLNLKNMQPQHQDC